MFQPPDVFDSRDEDDLRAGDEDDIVCNRCGTAGLYWQTVTTADGRGEKSVLFDARTKRPHKCEVSGDAFSAQPERDDRG